MEKVWRKQSAVSRSVSAENKTGGHGTGAMATEGYSSHAARELGQGWKVDPFTGIPAGEEKTLADIEGPGIIRHMIMIPLVQESTRDFILRIYWDGCAEPAVETPIGDFFLSANVEYWQVNSLLVCRNPKNGYNCYIEMPFRRRCRITLENLSEEEKGIAYSVDYVLQEVPQDALYFHAQFYRENPHPYKQDFRILDTVSGKGVYLGTYMVYGVTNNGWWGEGEFKAYLDGDRQFPTIVVSGTEDYFGGSFNFDVNNQPGHKGDYTPFSSPYTGFYKWKTDDAYLACARFSMYRWHLADPIHFNQNIRVEIQTLGWRSGGRYLPLQSADVSAIAYFYLDRPCCERRSLPDRDGLEII